MVFPFLLTFIYICTEWMKRTTLTKVNVLFSELVLNVWRENGCEGGNKKELLNLEYRVEPFKRVFVRMFSQQCIHGVYTLKFHPLDQVVENFQAFDILSTVDTPSCEQYSVPLKRAHR